MKIEGKFKSLVISHCEDIVLEMKSCLSGVEIINSKRVKVSAEMLGDLSLTYTFTLLEFIISTPERQLFISNTMSSQWLITNDLNLPSIFILISFEFYRKIPCFI
jgi:hypothetical protein